MGILSIEGQSYKEFERRVEECKRCKGIGESSNRINKITQKSRKLCLFVLFTRNETFILCIKMVTPTLIDQ